MKKIILKLSIVLMFFSIFCSISVLSHANKINSIDISIDISSDGTAHVTEIWKANLDSGTEGYKPYGNLGYCTIENFTVYDDSGKDYTYIPWNVNASFTSKAYKCGLRKTSQTTELCWGISEYGNRTYYLSYDITNFVNQYKDCYGVNFQILPIDLDQHPDSVSLKVSSNEYFDDSYANFYVLGCEGNTSIKNGNLYFQSSKKLGSHNYLQLLIKFDDSTFYTRNSVNTNFDSDLELAKDYEKKQERSAFFAIVIVITIIVISILFVILILILLYVYVKPELQFEGGRKLPPHKSVNYWREIPCSNNIFKAYWLAEKYSFMTDKSGLIGAILLSWVQKGYITITKTKAGLFSIKDNNYAIDFTNLSACDNPLENTLLDFFRSASGSNLILERNEFEKYCRTHYEAIEGWFKKVISEQTKFFEKDGLITEKTLERKVLFFHKVHSVKTASVALKEEATKLLGLKRFLLDYSLINKREVIEVKLWEDYLIFAQILGIADKVSEQFSKLYPDMNNLSNINTEFTTYAVYGMARSGYSAAHNAYSAAHTSSSGSGGGSHGGSSGGGFR